MRSLLLQCIRERLGYNQSADGDLDGKPRDLDADETKILANATWGAHHGLAVERLESALGDENRYDDAEWSPTQFKKFAAQREAEDGELHPRVVPEDGRDGRTMPRNIHIAATLCFLAASGSLCVFATSSVAAKHTTVSNVSVIDPN